MLRLSVMLLAVAVGALAAAWLQERSDARARRRRVARAVATDAVLWAAEEASGSAELHAPVGEDELSSQRATADARVDAAVKRAAAAEAAAAEAEQAAASYRDAYMQAVAAHQSREEQQPADGADAAEDAAHRDDADQPDGETSGDVSPSASGTDSDAEWDRVSLAAPQRCAWCGGDAHERCALVPCGHTACAACAHRAAACHACGEAVQFALQLRE